MMQGAVGVLILSALLCLCSGLHQEGHEAWFQPIDPPTLKMDCQLPPSGCEDNSADRAANSLSMVKSANKGFAFNLYRQLANQTDNQGKNIFFSPSSVSLALAVLSVGARGQTHQQLFSALGFNSSLLSQQDVDQAFRGLLTAASKTSSEDISAGVAGFVASEFRPGHDFLEVLKDSYLAEFKRVNFKNETASTATINDYVKEKTHGKIDKLLKKVDADTLMYLISYIYFKVSMKSKRRRVYTGRITRSRHNEISGEAHAEDDNVSQNDTDMPTPTSISGPPPIEEVLHGSQIFQNAESNNAHESSVTQPPLFTVPMNEDALQYSQNGPEIDEPSLSSPLSASPTHAEVSSQSGRPMMNSPPPPDEVPSQSPQLVSPAKSADNPEILREVRNALIHRVNVSEDLLAVFMDSSIMDCKLRMSFVNEKAIDDTVVSRDIYCAFWEKVLEQCEGEEERVPCMRPDYSEAHWVAVGRIWAKGLLDHGVLPVKLSKAFIISCIHGIDSVPNEVLLSSFLQFISPSERSVAEKALQGTQDESDEGLCELFTRMGYSVPPKDDLQDAFHSMAHKVIIQDAENIIDCFSKSMAGVQLKLTDKESVLCLYESKTATGKKVAQLLQATKLILTQREQKAFSYLQRYVKNADQSKAEKILHFCTACNVMSVEKIKVSFSGESGRGRKIVADTCEALLEVPYTFCSYPDFRTEFDKLLSNDFKMGIL